MTKLESSGFATDYGNAPPSATNTDRERALVEAYIGGDQGAFAVIFTDHYDALLARARRLLGTIGQPEDACQDTFRKALEGIWRFGWTGEYRLGAWLNTILHNVCVDQLARISRERHLAEAMSAQPQDEADVAEQVPDPGRLKAVQEAMRRLRPELRRALLLRELEGLSYAQVAAAEHISEDNARARACRARRFVQRQFPAPGQPTGAGISLGHQSTVKRVA